MALFTGKVLQFFPCSVICPGWLGLSLRTAWDSMCWDKECPTRPWAQSCHLSSHLPGPVWTQRGRHCALLRTPLLLAAWQFSLPHPLPSNHGQKEIKKGDKMKEAVQSLRAGRRTRFLHREPGCAQLWQVFVNVTQEPSRGIEKEGGEKAVWNTGLHWKENQMLYNYLLWFI